MGAIYDRFERELEGWRRKYAGRPKREMILLFLLALEREQIVSVGYSEELLAHRLKTLPISEEEREIVRHALLWAWKDEEMHAIYIRGAILKLESLPLKASAFMRQLAGAIGGWAGSVRQHVRWSDAPLSRALATLITWSGSLTGKVPSDVREHLRYGSFRDFCLFNIDAEKTAWLCWKRLIELVGSQPFLPANLADDFRRILADEERHYRIFEILAAAFDEQDRLAPGETADSLAQKIGAVGEFFLSRARRKSAVAENALGSGGRVRVTQGRSMEEKLPLFRRLLCEAGLAEQLAERARSLGKQVHDLRVAIKPTFMLGYHRKDRSVITDPALLDELACFLREQGCADVAVVESRNIYDQFYRNRTVQDVARYFDIASPHFRVVDLSAEQVPHSYFRGMAQRTIGRTWKEADFRISFAKMRSHPVELAHLTLSNMEWIGAPGDEFLFAERQAHRETATMMLLDEFPPHFSLLDAYEQAADGLAGIMGCPRPPSPKRFYAGTDALAVDMVAARHMGLTDPRECGILRAASHWFGGYGAAVEVAGTDEPLENWRSPYHNELSAMLSFFAFPVYSFGSGRGALFVPEMDEEAFPPINREGLPLRLGRRSLQTLLGLRHAK